MSNIDHLIQGKMFPSDKEKTIGSILYAANLIENYFDKILGKYGLTNQRLNVLRILREEYPGVLTLTQLQSKILDRKSDASRMVSRMCMTGFLKRHKIDDDKRIICISITEKGLKILKVIERQSEEMGLPTSSITDTDSKQLNDLIAKMLNVFNESSGPEKIRDRG